MSFYPTAISFFQSLYSPCQFSFLSRPMRSRAEALRETSPTQIVVDSGLYVIETLNIIENKAHPF